MFLCLIIFEVSIYNLLILVIKKKALIVDTLYSLSIFI